MDMRECLNVSVFAMSFPSKSPAASCILDPGLQIELDSQDSLDDSNSMCSCLECSTEQSHCTALDHESSDRSTGFPHTRSTLSQGQPVLRLEAADQQHSNTQVEVTAQTTSSSMSDNSFTVVLIPKVPILLFKKCLNCCGYEPLTAAIGVVALTICEFCPWLFGFIIVYYSYKSWGISSAIGSFILMIIAQALLRYFRAQDKLEDTFKSKNHLATQPHTEEVYEGVNEDIQEIVISEHPDIDEDQENVQATVEIVVLPPEQPPTYEAAVVKPPPYDLYYHLTPNASPAVARRQYLHVLKDSYDENFERISPALCSARTSGFSEEENHDDSLPTYQDAIIASSREDINFTQLGK